MAKDGLDLRDLHNGSLNTLADSNATGTTGDPRRTNAVASIRRTQADAYAPNTIGNRTEYIGIVVAQYEIDFPGFTDKAGLLKQYQLGTAIKDKETYENVEKTRKTAYKVFIPETDPRPVPAFNTLNDPVTLSLPEAYANIPGLETPIPPGAAVAVTYDNPKSLGAPLIIRVVTDQLTVGSTNLNDRGCKKWEGTLAHGWRKRNATKFPLDKHDSAHGHGDEKYERYTIKDTTRTPTSPAMGPYYPNAQFYPSYNWSKATGQDDPVGRIKWIIIHTTEIGSTQGNLNVLSGYRKSTGQMYRRKASTHYFVSKAGKVYCLVNDNLKAWQVGSKTPGRVTNSNAIGIEHEGWSADPSTWTPAMVNATAGLIAWLSQTYNIPLKYEGLGPRSYPTNSKGHPSLKNSGMKYKKFPNGTGIQTKLESGLIAHGKARIPHEGKYDPGVYFPFQEVIKKAGGTINEEEFPMPADEPVSSVQPEPTPTNDLEDPANW